MFGLEPEKACGSGIQTGKVEPGQAQITYGAGKTGTGC